MTKDALSPSFPSRRAHASSPSCTLSPLRSENAWTIFLLRVFTRSKWTVSVSVKHFSVWIIFFSARVPRREHTPARTNGLRIPPTRSEVGRYIHPWSAFVISFGVSYVYIVFLPLGLSHFAPQFRLFIVFIHFHLSFVPSPSSLLGFKTVQRKIIRFLQLCIHIENCDAHSRLCKCSLISPKLLFSLHHPLNLKES